MGQDKILFLAADTSRSKAYAQTMAERGVHVSDTLIFKRDDAVQNKVYKAKNGIFSGEGKINGILLPDLSVPLVASCSCISRRIHFIDSETVNSPEIIELIRAIHPDLVVYSGYGGQIVGNGLLSLKIPFLHGHGGYLPDFRGSTTQYYSIIQEKRCGVSVILLTDDIDRGPVVAKKMYPLPDACVDIDHRYDNALRADLLTEVLERLGAGYRYTPEDQAGEEGGMYYVIHPVLKHLAILALQPEFRKKPEHINRDNGE